MKNSKQLAINMAANVIAFSVQFGINFVLTPYIIGTIGSESYGFVSLANNFIGYMNILSVALNSVSSRFLTIEIRKKHTHKAQEYFNSILIANTILAIVLSIPSIVVIIFADKFMRIPTHLVTDVQLTFAYALLGMEISLILSVFGDVFYVINRLDLSAKRNIESNILRALLLITLFAFFRPKIYFINATMLIVTAYICATNVYYTRKYMPEMHIDKKKFSIRAIRTLLSAGIWNSVNQLSTVLLTTLDIYLANIFIGAQASGEYAVAKTVPNFIQSLVGVLVGVFIPQFMISYAKNDHKQLLSDVNFSVKFMGYIMMLPIGYLIVFGQNFFQVWVPTQNASLLHGLSLLTIIPMIITCSINTIFNVYTVTNKLYAPSLVLLITGIINTIIVIVLLNFTQLGIWAIPLTALVIGILRNITFTPIYAAKCLKAPWFTFYKAIFQGCCCVLTMAIVCLIYKSLFPVNSWFTIILSAMITALLAASINAFIVLTKNERANIIQIFARKLRRHK